MTPVATINWDLIRKEDDNCNSTGRNGALTMPPQSDVEDNKEELVLMQTHTQETEDEVDEETYFSPGCDNTAIKQYLEIRTR
jgi:hypothetical protein